MRRKKSALKFIFPLVCLVIIFFGGIFIFRSLMGKFLLSLFPISVPEPSAVSRDNSRPFASEDSRPLASPASTANGSFTELFSGTGWLNQEKSNVYQDQKLSSISFPPDYQWQEISQLPVTVIATASNQKEIVLITSDGEILTFDGNEAFSQPANLGVKPTKAVLAYDSEKGQWVLVTFSDDLKIFVFKNPADGISMLGSASQMDEIGDLVCKSGECLSVSGDSQSIYQFSTDNFNGFKNISISGKQDITISLGSVDSRSDSRLLAYTLVGVVEKTGGTYNGSIYKYSAGSQPSVISYKLLVIGNEPLFSSPYPGTIRFGYDSENAQILALYAAYIGQAKLFSASILNNQSIEVEPPLEVQPPNINIRVNPLLSSSDNPRSSASMVDYSRFFPQRVMDGDGVPKIFKYGNAWWLSSGIDQPATKFVRIEGGAGIDFADTLLRGQRTFELLPGFKSNELYAVVGNQPNEKIYKFIDKGYKKDKKIVWESLRLNRFDNEITGGKFYKINGSEESVIASPEGEKQSHGDIRVNPPLSSSDNPRSSASIFFYLSNDGGKNWQETKLNEMVNFTTKGNDFRFKVELSPSQIPRESASNTKTIRVNPLLNFTTLWLNLVSVEYYSKP